MKAFKKGHFSQSQITQWLLDLRDHSYVPESNFIVTAVFRVRIHEEKNYYFAGVNVENADHRIAIHGEESSIAGMVTAFGKAAEIVEGWVMGAPYGTQVQDGSTFSKAFITCCGKCRQQIAGLTENDVPIHFVSLNGGVRTTTVKEFLPDRFSFRDMIPKFFAHKELDNCTSMLAAENIENRLIRHEGLSHQEIKNWLSELQSIDYISQISQSAIIHLDNNFYVAGTKMEDAAFQSLTAPQAAVAIATTEFGARCIKEVFVLTHSHDNKKLPLGAYGTLSMSALQTILQTAAHNRILIHFFNDSPHILTLNLNQAADVSPSSTQSFYKP